MKTMNNYKRGARVLLPALVATFCLLTACYDEIGKGNEITSSDGEIDFSATTAIETGSGLPQTKTQFSGTRISYNVSYTPSKKIERINWVSGDLIRIYSPQAQNAEAITYHNLRPAETNRMHVWADYKIGNSKDNLKNDTATVVTPLYVGKFPNGRDSYNGIRWNEKETEYKGKDHHFYGLYPSPRTDSDTPQLDSGGNPLPLMVDAAGNQHPLAISIDPATNVATITGFIPPVQNPVERKSQPVERINENGSTSDWTTSWTAREFIPDMYYAAMAAYCKAKEPTNWREKNIELGFKPLFTSLRLELLADADDEINVVDVTPEDDPEGLYTEPGHQRFKLPLTKLELYKTQDGVTPDKTLAGSYQVKIGGNLSTPESPVYVGMAGNESDKITMDLGSGVYLYTHADKNKALRTAFTFLCAPGPQDHLYIRLTFSDSVTVTRTITLRTLSDASNPSNPVLDWITIDSMKKLYLDAVAVNKEYYFESTEPIALDRTLPTGTSKLDYKDILRVKSYKRHADGRPSEQVPWDIAPGNSYYYDGSWHAEPPIWLDFTANYKAGCGENDPGEPVDVVLNKNNGAPRFNWGANTSQKIAGAKNLVGLKDQSIVTYENNPGMETANCYIISSPGWYKLPCLYGNVCRGGIETNNTAAYNRGNTYSAPILGPFVNHENKKLTGSWIKQNLGNEDPDEAVLLWQDSKNLVKNLEINRRTYGGAASGQPWVYFYVDVITPGNAVIAVKKDGVVVWSWHLWFLPSNHIVEKRVDSNQDDGNWYNAPDGYDSMMTLNLGYAPQEAVTVPPRECKVRLRQRDSGLETIVTIVQNGVEAHPADWPFYQWGRKDPLFPVHWSDGVVQLEKTKVYDEAGNIVSFQSADPDGFSNFSIGRGIREPMTLFTDNNKSGKSWYGSNRYDNLWNVNITSSVWNTSDRDGVTYTASGKADNSSVKKTIYDPCPPGYCVPGRNAFTGFHSKPDVPAELGHSGNGQSWPRSDQVSDSNDPNRCRHEFIEAGNVNTIRALTSETDLIKEGFNFYTNSISSETINFPLTGRIAGNKTRDAERERDVEPGDILAEHYGAYWTAAPYYSPGEMYYARTLLFMIFQETREDYKPTPTSENFWSLFVYPVFSKNSPFDPGGFMQSHGQAVRCVKERK